MLSIKIKMLHAGMVLATVAVDTVSLSEYQEGEEKTGALALEKKQNTGGRKMKRIVWFMFLVMLTFGCTAGSLNAEETEVSGSASVDVMSNYVWRGQKLSNSYVIQPSVGITYGGFGANLWSNIDPDWDDETEITETDVTVNYAFSIEKFSFDVGYIYYGLEAAEDTQEFYISAGYDMMLSPSLTLYYDFDVGEGGFVIASIGHAFELTKDIAVNLGASASYNISNEVMGFDEDGDDFSDFYNGEISASVSIPVWKAISIEPKIAYSFPLSDDAEDAIEAISDDGDGSIVYGGVNISLSF